MDSPEAWMAGAARVANRHGLRPRLAWFLWTVAAVQVAFGLLLAALNQLTLTRFFAEYVMAQTTATLAFATVGLLIVTRRPNNTVGWLLCAAGVGYGFTAWIQPYTRYTMVTAPGALPGAEVLAWIMFWSWIPIISVALVFLPLLFPNGRLPSPRWRALVWLAVAAIILLAVSLALRPGPLDAALPEVSNPFAPAGAERLLRFMMPLAVSLMLASLMGAVAAPVVRFRRARGTERQQLKWFAFATALLVAAMVIPAAMAYPDFTKDTLLSGTVLTVAYAFFPIAVGVAILRHRLYDIDLIISGTLVYGTLTACVVGVYVFVVGYLGALFNTGGNLLISLVATGVVAVLFQPLRSWLQRGVNRLLYGERDEPYAVLARLGQRLEAALVPEAVLPTMVATVKDALKLPYVAVALKRDGAFTISAAEGTMLGQPLSLPLSYQGEVVGQLLVSPRSPGEAWSTAERHLLDDLAHHAGVAVHGVRLMTELQMARERLVLAREEERRRLRRDLHDDLAPTLAALGLTAATVGELIPSDPAAATAALNKLQAAIRAAVGEVRRVAHDLRPPTLDELGLVGAIREHVDAYNASQRTIPGVDALQLRLEVPERLPTLPAAVEVAAYRIVQEALMNVTRHAHAHGCTIRLDCVDTRALQVEVIDDGVGLPEAHKAGVGLRSMEERAAELGGACEIARLVPRGTRVAAWLPISKAPEVEGYGRATYPDR